MKYYSIESCIAWLSNAKIDWYNLQKKK
jgi:hypothetical protein